MRSLTRWFSGNGHAATRRGTRRLRISDSSVGERDADDRDADRAENEGYPLGRRDRGEGPPTRRRGG